MTSIKQFFSSLTVSLAVSLTVGFFGFATSGCKARFTTGHNSTDDYQQEDLETEPELVSPNAEVSLVDTTDPQGENGLMGPIGPQGNQGMVGPTGPTGPRGLTGTGAPASTQTICDALGLPYNSSTDKCKLTSAEVNKLSAGELTCSSVYANNCAKIIAEGKIDTNGQLFTRIYFNNEDCPFLRGGPGRPTTVPNWNTGSRTTVPTDFVTVQGYNPEIKTTVSYSWTAEVTPGFGLTLSQNKTTTTTNCSSGWDDGCGGRSPPVCTTTSVVSVLNLLDCSQSW